MLSRQLFTALRAPTTLRNMSSVTVRPSTVPLVVTPKYLSPLLEKDGVRVLDATWFMPNVPRNAAEEFQRGPRLPTAQFWDVDKVATVGESVRNLPHMMPTPEVFAKAAGEHGITPDTHVVVYDTHGVFSAPRTAFTFKAFGHPKVSVLNGGLPAWIHAGFPVEEGEPKQKPQSESYPTPQLSEGVIRSFDEMVANARMGARGQTVFDARPQGRFDGTAPEPRAGLSSGHIPHSLSLPFSSLLKTVKADGKSFTVLKDQIELWRVLSDAVGGTEALEKLRQASSGGELAATNTCGSGMTAACIWLALQELGVQSAIYDEVSTHLDDYVDLTCFRHI